jgi:hypothetical protein
MNTPDMFGLREVPDLRRNNCHGCYFDKVGRSCLEVSTSCIEDRCIYIEDTEESFVTYIAARLEG